MDVFLKAHLIVLPYPRMAGPMDAAARRSIRRHRKHRSGDVIATCPAGPPNLIIPSFNQNRSASPSVGTAVAELTSTETGCVTTGSEPYDGERPPHAAPSVNIPGLAQ